MTKEKKTSQFRSLLWRDIEFITVINDGDYCLKCIQFSRQTSSRWINETTTNKVVFHGFSFFILFYTFPAGMVLYWTASNSMQLIKTLVVKYKTW